MIKTKLQKIGDIKTLVEEIVEQKLVELLGDPDLGSEMKEKIKKRLKRTMNEKNGIEINKIVKQLGLKW